MLHSYATLTYSPSLKFVSDSVSQFSENAVESMLDGTFFSSERLQLIIV